MFRICSLVGFAKLIVSARNGTGIAADGWKTMPSPSAIVRHKRAGWTVVGWKLDPDRRAELLEEIPPRYEQAVADHVTLVAKVAADTPLPDPVTAQAIGHADDGKGVEALVVEIDGETNRPGGSTYHITWSLADGRKAVESNDVLGVCGWHPLPAPLPLQLTPARF